MAALWIMNDNGVYHESNFFSDSSIREKMKIKGQELWGKYFPAANNLSKSPNQ